MRFGADGISHRARPSRPTARHEIGVGFERAGKRKRVRIDGVIPERLSDALGALPSVMFSPADVELVVGPPNARRRFLDIMLALTTRGYLDALQRYRAALAATQRGASRGARARGRAVDGERRGLGAGARRAWRGDLERAARVGGVGGGRVRAVCAPTSARAGRVRISYASTVALTDDRASRRSPARSKQSGRAISRAG